MHSGQKMAEGSYFPSIHDKTDRHRIWPSFTAEARRFAPGAVPRRSSWNKTDRADQRQRAALRTSNLTVPDYQPLEVFSTAAALAPGAALWSEADEICELSIRLKEFELCEMMQDAPKIQENKPQRNITFYRVKSRGQRK